MPPKHFITSQIEELEKMESTNRITLLENLATNQYKIKSSLKLYYDQHQDEMWKKEYYSVLAMRDRDSKQLFTDFHTLIVSTHTYQLPYYISKDKLYTWIDLQPNGELIGIYSGERKTPHQVIEEDYDVIQKRFQHYKKIIKYYQFNHKRVAGEVNQVTRQHRFNTEHVVPQSWFNANEPMKGDLHHLFVCEPLCNNARSNFPYFDYRYFPDLPKTFQNYCGTYETGRFEPTYGKGAVARATLYFLLRYPGKIKKSFRKSLNLSLLKQWNDEFPVNLYEKHRNKAIYEIQGNRNPFIDYPDLAKEINFETEKEDR